MGIIRPWSVLEGTPVDFMPGTASPFDHVPSALFGQDHLTHCDPALFSGGSPLVIVASPFVLIRKLSRLCRQKLSRLTSLERGSSKKQEVKCYHLTFGLDLPRLSLPIRQTVDQDECVFPSQITKPANMSLEGSFSLY